MREFNKSNLDLTMREVRVEEAIRKVAEAAKTSAMDSSKKVDFMVLAKMMSDSDIGRVRLESDDLNIQERVGITEVSDTPKVGIIRRFRDPSTGEMNEAMENMTPEQVVDYAVSRIDKEKFGDAKRDYYYDEVRKEIIGQISKTRLTDNDKVHLEAIASLVSTSIFSRVFFDHAVGSSLSTIGITKVQNPDTGKEEHRLAIFKKQKDAETGKVTETAEEKSLEDILLYSLTRIPKETMQKGRELALRERARIRIEEDIDKSGLPEEERIKLKAIEYIVLSSRLNRVNLKQTHPRVEERLSIKYDENPRLGILRRQRDPETGAGEEGFIEMSLVELSKYVDDRIPESSRDQIRQ